MYSPSVTAVANLPRALSAINLTEGSDMRENGGNGFFIHTPPPRTPIPNEPLHLAASQQQTQHPHMNISQHNTRNEHKKTISALCQFEKVWLRIRQLQLAISEVSSVLNPNSHNVRAKLVPNDELLQK